MTDDDRIPAGWDLSQPDQFLTFAALFQGVMLGVAVVLGWWADINPWEHLRFEPLAVGWSFAALLPLCLLSVVIDRVPWSPFERMKTIWFDTLGPVLVQCGWWELTLLSLLVGASEELLFRGVLQPWISRYDFWTGLILSNVLFGLAHAVTPTYVVFAGLIGLYLAGTMQLTESPNLLIPILCHAGCDLFGFGLIRHRYREHLQHQPDV